MSGALRAQKVSSLDAVILAGGMGTRLDSVLHGTPKLLAPIGGRPFLDYLMAWLGRFGMARVILSLGHLGEKVVQYLESNPYPTVEIAAYVEPKALGTAGGLRFVRNHIRTNPALVMNGDTFVSADLNEFMECHVASQASGTILCTEIDDADRYGQIELDENDRISRFVEKASTVSGRGLISTGVYLLGADLLNAIARGDQASLEKDIFARLPGGSLGAMAGSFEFIDIGTPESLRDARAILSHQFPDL